MCVCGKQYNRVDISHKDSKQQKDSNLHEIRKAFVYHLKQFAQIKCNVFFLFPKFQLFTLLCLITIKFLLLAVPVIKSYSCIIPREVPDQRGHNVVNLMYNSTSNSSVIIADNT